MTERTSTRLRFPPDWSVDRALETYLSENGFTREAYDLPSAEVAFLTIPFRIPNPPSRQRAVRWHDLHHVATGFGTNIADEIEITGWELRRGLDGVSLYVRAILFSILILGWYAPRRFIRAWNLSVQALREPGEPPRFSLFPGTTRYEEILQWNVGQLRSYLRIPPEGLHVGVRGLHASAPRPS